MDDMVNDDIVCQNDDASSSSGDDDAVDDSEAARAAPDSAMEETGAGFSKISPRVRLISLELVAKMQATPASGALDTMMNNQQFVNERLPSRETLERWRREVLPDLNLLQGTLALVDADSLVQISDGTGKLNVSACMSRVEQ